MSSVSGSAAPLGGQFNHSEYPEILEQEDALCALRAIDRDDLHTRMADVRTSLLTRENISVDTQMAQTTLFFFPRTVCLVVSRPTGLTPDAVRGYLTQDAMTVEDLLIEEDTVGSNVVRVKPNFEEAVSEELTSEELTSEEPASKQAT